MTDLLLDLGNTRIKWALRRGESFSPGRALLYGGLSLAELLLDSWKSLETPHRAVVSSVASENLMQEVIGTLKTLWPDCVVIRAQSQHQACGVTNAYHNSSRLGVDRWLCLVAAYRYYPLPACIVDCGTAITVDLLDAAGNHLGGMIAPGLTLMKKSLQRGTQHLPYNEVRYALSPAADTEAAIYSGTLSAALGLIEFVMKQQAADTKLLLTGGDAQLIAGHLSLDPIIDPDLVLRGLAVAAEIQ